MRWTALACDYDGTLAHHGKVDAGVILALERCRASGRKVLMVTGREIPDLQSTFSRFDAFDCIVAENGALLYDPATGRETKLAEPPVDLFVQTLRDRGVETLSQGRVIVATWSPHETVVLETIRDLGLELQVIFNKGAVMVLPSGVNKATGLVAALKRLGIPANQVVAIGDAENDHALLDAVGLGVAVSNAVPMLQERADLVTSGDHGAGVIELVERLLTSDLSGVTRRPRA